MVKKFIIYTIISFIFFNNISAKDNFDNAVSFCNSAHNLSINQNDYIPSKHNYVEYFLTLFKDNTYELTFILKESYSDMEIGGIISKGTFSIEMDEIHFRDSLYKFEFIAIHEANTLTFTKSFSLLEGVILTEHKNLNYNIIKTIDIDEILQAQKDLIIDFKDLFNDDIDYKFISGTYVSFHDHLTMFTSGDKHQLIFRDDSTFQYKFLGKTILDCRWSKSSNKIKVIDEKSKMTYKMTVVGNNKIFIHDIPILGYYQFHGRSRIKGMIPTLLNSE